MLSFFYLYQIQSAIVRLSFTDTPLNPSNLLSNLAQEEPCAPLSPYFYLSPVLPQHYTLTHYPVVELSSAISNLANICPRCGRIEERQQCQCERRTYINIICGDDTFNLAHSRSESQNVRMRNGCAM